MATSRTKFNNIDKYIASFPEETQKILEQLRITIRKAAPEAEEKINYGIPTFTLKGNLVHFAAFKNHIGFYPTPSAIEAFKKDLSVYEGAKGSVKFPVDKPLPFDLITRIVKFRIKKNLEKTVTPDKPGLILKTILLLFVLFIHEVAFTQSHEGRVLSGVTNSAIGFVNVGIIGKNVGTVADESGNYAIALDHIYDNDSLRFSMIGYEPKAFLVRTFRENSIKVVFLNPRVYDLGEVTVTFHKTRKIRLGVPVLSNDLKSGFANNELGSELGIKVNTRGLVQLEDINLNVATCTYDSVTYRLNIYKSVNQNEFKNILTEPIYITFSKDKIDNVITLDLKKYSILIKGDYLITLELYKDLGEGRLLFHTQYFTGTTYHRKTSEGKWIAAPGLVGMYLHGQLIK